MTGPLNTTLKLPKPDQVIAGKYRIISRLGSGGMALVYLAEQLGVGKQLAIKFLEPAPDDESRIPRFLREAKVGLAVQHPGAAQVLDLGRDEDGRLFLCFELVEGEDLREILKREGRMTFREAREVTLQIAQVLAFAHERGIVHRDVKPENIRVRRDLAGPHVKMLDFGIARLLKDSGVRLTAEGMLAGTPRYMAPEQVRDEALDGRTDQYALGLVFYEMLTGAVAIGGKNVMQILTHQMQTLVPPLAFVDPALASPAVDAFLARACAKDPSGRYPTMAEFIVALRGLRIDERAWPPPRVPTLPEAVITADARPKPPVPDVSDTLVRVPERTQLERRMEVPTDPVREAVEPRPRVSSTPGTDPSTALTPPGRPPVEVAGREVLEMPTDPFRPMVPREGFKNRATVPSRGVQRLPETAVAPQLVPDTGVAPELEQLEPVTLPPEAGAPSVVAAPVVPVVEAPPPGASTQLPSHRPGGSRWWWWLVGVIIGLLSLAGGWWLLGQIRV
ncbi:MAG: protein kinase [Myxococcaceae bacterium]